MRRIHSLSGPIAAVTVILGLIAPCLAEEENPAGGEKLFTVHMKIDFEVEEINIPGWEGGPYSEPEGGGEVELGLNFNSDGGFFTVQVGNARIQDYACKGSAGCRCTAPPELFSNLWAPVTFEDIRWDPDSKMMILQGPARHPQDLTTVKVDCPGVSTAVEDHPLHKLLGAFGPENEQRKNSGFLVSLAGEGPWTKTFPRELFGIGPKTFRATIVITVTEGGTGPGQS